MNDESALCNKAYVHAGNCTVSVYPNGALTYILLVFVTELLDDVLKEKPQEADGIDSVVVVDNVPQVGPERLEKLKNVIHKIFSKFGKITTEFYPEADGATKGYVLHFTGVVPDVALMAYLRFCKFPPQVHLSGVRRPHPGSRSC